MMTETAVSVVVIGASGDLARRKIFPALFALFCQKRLPEAVRFFGFARSAYSDEQFRQRVMEHLTCRYTPEHSCAERMAEFLARCYYVAGEYGARDAYLDLYQRMQEVEGADSGAVNRLFYLAIPPGLFMDVAGALGGAGFVRCEGERPWSRVVIEKPFGRDRVSSDELTRELATVFREEQTYRIDHYLGKEIVQNLMVLRFANLVFEPLWNAVQIESVQVDWREDAGIEGRGGYFDHYGIIRDVIQNHLLQVSALVTMERPDSIDAKSVRDAKLAVVQSIPPLTVDDVVVGQYAGGEYRGRHYVAYRDEAHVAAGSRTPTWAAVRLRIDRPRWQGVPFVISAGKALDRRESSVVVRFRPVQGNIFCRGQACPPANEMVIRIQPDEGIFLRIISKAPGLEMVLAERELNLRYDAAFQEEIPDAYECLLLDVIEGDRSLFIRSDELAAAWDLFTPVLAALEGGQVEPELYAFGAAGPSKGVARVHQWLKSGAK